MGIIERFAHQLWCRCRSRIARHLRNSIVCDRCRIACRSRWLLAVPPRTSAILFEPSTSNRLPCKTICVSVWSHHQHIWHKRAVQVRETNDGKALNIRYASDLFPVFSIFLFAEVSKAGKFEMANVGEYRTRRKSIISCQIEHRLSELWGGPG